MMILISYGSVSILDCGSHALTHSICIDPSSDRIDQGAGPTIDVRLAHSGSDADSSAGCLICEHHVQGQLASEPILVVSRPYTSPHVASILSLIATLDGHPSSCPRAPPLSPPSVA
jgi:hypothetical protein